MTGDRYFRVGGIIGSIVALITFIGSWWYCAVTYGFLLGFGLGWLPAAIAAAIAGALSALLWGPVLFLVALGVLWLFYENSKDPSELHETAGLTAPYGEFGDKCIEQIDANGAVTSLRCGDVILPIGDTLTVSAPTGEATPAAPAQQPMRERSAARSVESYSEDELMAISGPLDAGEGRTVTNRRTGERVVLRNGQWVRTPPPPPCIEGSASCKPWERNWPAGENEAPTDK